MGRQPKNKLNVMGAHLIASGDVVSVMDQGAPVKCRVLSCLIEAGGSCHAVLEILEGERSGEKIRAKLRAQVSTDDQEASPPEGQ